MCQIMNTDEFDT